jgi:DNA-binding response OmpR family regulator
MPGGSGRDLVRRLRDSGYQGKIVVLSACVSPEEEIEYRVLGVSELVPKPLSLGQLRRAVGL